MHNISILIEVSSIIIRLDPFLSLFLYYAISLSVYTVTYCKKALSLLRHFVVFILFA